VDDPRVQLALDIAGFTHDPVGYFRYAFRDDLRAWQKDVLEIIGKHLSNPETRYMPCQVGIASGHGIGKSALIAIISKWGLDTCEDCRIVVTANTETQLRTKTWPEISKWHKKSVTADWFHIGATSILSKDKDHEKQWRMDCVAWSETNTEAFAGLHNKGKRIIVIYDEASSIADAVWQVTQGALTDTETEIIFIAFGNPTKNTGAFRECFGRQAHRWYTRQIDSRTVEGTNQAEISKWAEDWGEDSDFFRVRVRGEFPRAGSNQFIASDVVAAARKREAIGFETLPIILSCDVARFGEDRTVIGMRQGRRARVLGVHRGLDTVQVAERMIEHIQRLDPDAVVVDGDGLGAGTVDHLRARGFDKRNGKRILHEFHGGEKAFDDQLYMNRRAEIWGKMRDWLPDSDIEDDPALDQDLSSPEYGFDNKGRIQLERKVDMKKRGLASPDQGDQLAMTFAVSVNGSRVPVIEEEDPIEAAMRRQGRARPNAWMG
jgi:hypothetical protein